MIDNLLLLQTICICLFALLLQLIGVDSHICDDIVVDSTAHFVQMIKVIQESPSQENCYNFDFGQGSFEFDLNETLNVSANVTLHGMGAIITCSYPSKMFNYSAIIRVTNVQYFGISGIAFIKCPSSLHFENVSSVSINDSHFRYSLITTLVYLMVAQLICIIIRPESIMLQNLPISYAF